MMKRSLMLLVCAALCAAVFTSCRSAWDSFTGSLGFDTKDYSSETITANYTNDSEKAAELCGYVRMLVLDSPFIPEFRSSSEAIGLFRDSVLNYMLSSNYSRYTGNLERLDEASEKYPAMNIASLIPAKEFEQTYYTYFGGSTKITNKTADYFMYLSKLDAYTALAEPILNEIRVTPLSVAETANTYRFSVRLTYGANSSPEYNVVMIKREDGSAYFRSVTEADNSDKS